MLAGTSRPAAISPLPVKDEITTLSKLGQKRSEKKTQLVRLGQREIETLGLSQGFWSDLYHRSMAVSWPVFFGSAAALFVALNAVFGFLYSLGREPIANAAQNGPLASFYFSIETLATVGYGDMHPQTNYGHLIATIEIFTGMCFLAVMTGLIFARFSAARPFRVRQQPCDHTPRRATNADDPHGKRAAQRDLTGQRAAVDHSRGAHKGRRPTETLLRAEARSHRPSYIRTELDAIPRH